MPEILKKQNEIEQTKPKPASSNPSHFLYAFEHVKLHLPSKINHNKYQLSND